MEPENKSITIENWKEKEELALMSIGTDKGSWWADPNFGSELFLLQRNGRVDGRTAGTLRRMLLECLQWMIDDGLVKKISCQTERIGKNEIQYYIIFYDINGNNREIKEVWNAF